MIIKNDLNNLKKILFISKVINNKINNAKLIKKNFYGKYEKTNKIILSGMNSGIDIKPFVTYVNPFDKLVQLKFKTNINIDDLILEQTNNNIRFELNQNDFLMNGLENGLENGLVGLSTDDLIRNINIYIDGVKKLEPNIYQEFDILVDNQNTEEITFNNQIKYKII